MWVSCSCGLGNLFFKDIKNLFGLVLLTPIIPRWSADNFRVTIPCRYHIALHSSSIICRTGNSALHIHFSAFSTTLSPVASNMSIMLPVRLFSSFLSSDRNTSYPSALKDTVIEFSLTSME